MNPKRKSLIALVLAAVTLAAPGSALAGPGPMPMPVPAVEPITIDVQKEPPVVVPLTVAKISREEAIAAVTKLFAIPADMGAPNVSLSQNKGNATWELSWRTAPNKANPRHYTIMVNAVTGQVAHYNYSSAAANDTPLSFSRGEAQKKAAAWLDKLVPELKQGLRYVDNPLQYGFYGGASFRFHWDRMEQGYPVREEGVDITIDARTGELQAYSMNWRDGFKAEKPAAILEQAKAEDAYRQRLPMQMMFRYYQKRGTDKGEWKLIYRPYNTGLPYVNQEGKLLQSWTGEPIDFTQFSNSQLVPAGSKPYVKPEQPLSHEAALLIAQAVTNRKETPTNMDCREEGDGQKRQYCHFNWYDEKGYSSNVQLDMATGLVVHYGNWGPTEPGMEKAQPKYTEAQARKIALDFIYKYRADMAGNALMSPSNDQFEKVRIAAGEPVRSYRVTFTMTREYVPIWGMEANMEIDAMTGEIRYFSSPMSERAQEEKYPELKDLITGADAIEFVLKHQGLELAWVTFNSEPYARKLGLAESKSVTTLVWAPRQALSVDAIDANTGVPYDYEGRDLIEAAKRPIDIEGHPAQREIEILWARGIFDLKDGKFNPDQTISAAELSRWLVLARGMQPYPMYDFAGNFTGRGEAGSNLAKSSEAAYIGAALQAGIMMPEDFATDADPNAPVSREMYALWVVRALGYGDIAKMEARIEMPFADKAAIGAKYANAVALLNGLKVIAPDAAGKFDPQASITRGGAAKMLFAVASKTRFYW